LISTATPPLWCVVMPPPETKPVPSSTAGAVLDGNRHGGRSTRWQMLEPYAGKLARPVLRGPGRSQDVPGHPTLPANALRSVDKSSSPASLTRLRSQSVGPTLTLDPRDCSTVGSRHQRGGRHKTSATRALADFRLRGPAPYRGLCLGINQRHTI
jgi:hypothetical protein